MTKDISGSTGDSKRISISSLPDQPHEIPDPPSWGDFDIRIDRDGTWYYKNSPIRRKALVKLFSSALMRESDGQYWLVTPTERGRVAVQDAPFTAVELSVTGRGAAQVLHFRTNLEEWVESGPGHPIRMARDPGTREPRPYVLVRDSLEALILRSVYYELVAHGVERAEADGTIFGVWSNNIFFPLGCLD